MEQVWWDVVEFSGCEWVACIVPITHTRAMQSTHTALNNVPRLVLALLKIRSLLNDSTLILLSDVGTLRRTGQKPPNAAPDLDILSHS